MIPPLEPDVASSDATNMECTLHREEDEFIINGKKWWSSGMFISISEYISKMKTETCTRKHHQTASDSINKLVQLAYNSLLKFMNVFI